MSATMTDRRGAETSLASTEVLSALAQLIRTSRAIARQHQDQLGASGTPVAVLKALLHPEEGHDRPGDLAVATGVAPSVVSRVIARLEEEGLVSRRRDEADARACHISLTQAGRRRLEAIDRAYSALLDEALGDLTDDDLERIPPILRRLESALTRAAAPKNVTARTATATNRLHQESA